VAEGDLRLFVAVELPDHVLSALAGAIEQLKTELSGAFRWVAARNIHLTLKFLGDVEPGSVPSLTGALNEATSGIGAPLSLELAGTGAFYKRRTPTVVWAGVGGDTGALLSLRDAAESSLVAAGHAPERTAFSPHLTLARVRGVVSPEEAERLRNLLASPRFDEARPFAVKGVHLIRSELLPGGARYTKLAEAHIR
jgi:2'-5' RNA ligase